MIKSFIIKYENDIIASLQGPKDANINELNRNFYASGYDRDSDGEPTRDVDKFVYYLMAEEGFRRPWPEELDIADLHEYDFRNKKDLMDMTGKFCVVRGPWALRNQYQWCKRNELIWIMSAVEAANMAEIHGGKVIPAPDVFANEKERLQDERTRGILGIPTNITLEMCDRKELHPLERAIIQAEKTVIEAEESVGQEQ